jgi:hypothetical protein
MAHIILVRRIERNGSFGRSKHSWENNITMELKEIMWKIVDCIHIALDRDPLVATCKNYNENSGYVKETKFLD